MSDKPKPKEKLEGKPGQLHHHQSTGRCGTSPPAADMGRKIRWSKAIRRS